MLSCSTGLRALGRDADSMEQAAGEIVSYLRTRFLDKDTGEPSLALVRFYKLMPFERLEPDLQTAALAAGADAGSFQGVPCLTLLASAGEEEAWNDRRRSSAHRAIPLPSTEAVAQLPMVAQLIAELGFDAEEIVRMRSSEPSDASGTRHKVFFVREALDSPHVPAQGEFVVPYGIRSVLGFGGVLPDGSTFAVVMFSTTPIPQDTADSFGVIGLSVKSAVLPFVEGRTFDTDPLPGADTAPDPDQLLRVTSSQLETLQQLLDVRERAVAIQATRLRHALEEARDRAEQLTASRQELAASEARKAAIVNGALDCIISIDGNSRILEFNPAAESTFGYERAEVIGEVLADLILPVAMRGRHLRGMRHYLETGEGPILNRRIEVTAVRRDGSELPVELTVTPVADADPPVFTGYLRDITDRHRAESDARRNRERLAHIAHTLQASLLPPQLPHIDALELASVYRPAGEGNEVGGDFYDVFELTDTRWALVLGDVCGKGPEAAAVTALARYTVRAAAIRMADDPAGVLGELHDAMVRQRPDSFCTLVYAVVQPDRQEIEIVLGGHPPALRVTQSGDVTEVGGRGPLLGLIDRWSADAERVQLAPGDTIVLYSDGVTEARRGGELFGSERLRAAAATAARSGSHGIVAAIERAVIEFADGLTDDVAILAATVRAT